MDCFYFLFRNFQSERSIWQLTSLLLTTLEFLLLPKLRWSLTQEAIWVTFEHLTRSHAHSTGTTGATQPGPPHLGWPTDLVGLTNSWPTLATARHYLSADQLGVHTEIMGKIISFKFVSIIFSNYFPASYQFVTPLPCIDPRLGPH